MNIDSYEKSCRNSAKVSILLSKINVSLTAMIICDYHNFDQFGLSVIFLNLYKIKFVLSVTIGFHEFQFP